MDTLKKFADTVKATLLYIIAPVAFVLGYIWFLFQKNKGLQDKLNQSKAQEEIAKTEVEKEKIDEKANSSTDDYYKLRDEYLRQSTNNLPKVDPGLRQGPPGQGPTDPDKKPSDQPE